MTTEETLTTINIFLTSITLGVGYLTYRFSKKKDFEDKLFQIKIDAFKEINDACFSAYQKLDVNSTPFVEMYDFKSEKEWRKYHKKKITPLFKIGIDIEKLVFKHTLFLPPKIVDKIDNYGQYCLSYITQYGHFDSGLNCESYDRLWEMYTELLGLLREDLKVLELEKGLVSRIKRMIG